MKHILVIGISFCPAILLGVAAAQRNLPGPTYYIAINAQRSDPHEIRFLGASNLPSGSEIAVQVSEFFQGGWEDYSDNMCVAVDEHGFFSGNIRPQTNMKFKNNLVLRADFGTRLCHQPDGTLRVLGKHGERLANVDNPKIPLEQLDSVSRNPQLFRWSGWYYGLEAITRVLTGGSWPENSK